MRSALAPAEELNGTVVEWCVDDFSKTETGISGVALRSYSYGQAWFAGRRVGRP